MESQLLSKLANGFDIEIVLDGYAVGGFPSFSPPMDAVDYFAGACLRSLEGGQPHPPRGETGVEQAVGCVPIPIEEGVNEYRRLFPGLHPRVEALGLYSCYSHCLCLTYWTVGFIWDPFETRTGLSAPECALFYARSSDSECELRNAPVYCLQLISQ